MHPMNRRLSLSHSLPRPVSTPNYLCPSHPVAAELTRANFKSLALISSPATDLYLQQTSSVHHLLLLAAHVNLNFNTFGNRTSCNITSPYCFVTDQLGGSCWFGYGGIASRSSVMSLS